ncbi:MAG TPA: RyR domain-containing protein, partial [Methylovirgula sp.]
KGRGVTQVVAADDDISDASRSTQIALPFTTTALGNFAGLRRAKRIVFDTGDIAANMALARDIRHELGDRAPPISCNIESAHLADEFSDLLGVQRDILIYDEARLAVRDTLARHPLYASADRQGAKRVHILIVGFGHFGRVLLDEAVQDSIAGTLEKPTVTILDRDAERLARAFGREKPAHGMAADIAFIAFDSEHQNLNDLFDPTEGMQALHARDAAAAVTTVAFCLPTDSANVALAMSLRDLRRRSGRLFAPVFMYMRAPEASVFFNADRDRVVDPFDSIVPIRLSREALAIEILAEGERDRLAKHLHTSFRALSGEEQSANASWTALAETYRRANRHAADHMAAKLWSLGLATERHSTESGLSIDAAWERSVEKRLRDLEHVARLEHRRWIADRVMEGWTFAKTRDDDRRHHPDLVPFEDISIKEQNKDRDQIAQLQIFMKQAARAHGHRFMPEFLVGVSVAPDVELSALNPVRPQIEEQLATHLKSLAEHQAVSLVSCLTPGTELALVEALAASIRERLYRGSAPAPEADLRLIALEGVPYPVLLKMLFKDAATREHEMHAAFAVRRRLFRLFHRVEAIRTGPRGHSDDSIFRDAKLFVEARASADAYLARRADLLCVVSKKGNGTSDLLAYWTGAKTIPAKLDPRPSRRWSGPSVLKKPLIAIEV